MAMLIPWEILQYYTLHKTLRLIAFALDLESTHPVAMLTLHPLWSCNCYRAATASRTHGCQSMQMGS